MMNGNSFFVMRQFEKKNNPLGAQFEFLEDFFFAIKRIPDRAINGPGELDQHHGKTLHEYGLDRWVVSLYI